MEAKSTAKEVKRLLIGIDYAHNILPYYGFLHHAGYLMTLLSSKTSNLFHENIKILRSITFSSISSLKVLGIRQNFNEKLSEYIISHKLYLYFTFDIILNTNKEIDDFKVHLLDNLPFIDQSMFKRLFFKLTTEGDTYNKIIKTFQENGIPLDGIYHDAYINQNSNIKLELEYSYQMFYFNRNYTSKIMKLGELYNSDDYRGKPIEELPQGFSELKIIMLDEYDKFGLLNDYKPLFSKVNKLLISSNTNYDDTAELRYKF